jgi:type III pantothenate kinase
MNILYVDVGNSAIKWLFNGEYHTSLIEDFELNLLPNAEQNWVSCVAHRAILKGLKTPIFVQSLPTFQHFTSAYPIAKDLGVDRFLAMLAGAYQNPNQNLLIIDVGSALTIDLVLSGRHQGGLIMPGLGAVRRCFTPFATDSKNLTFGVADNTAEAWASGTASMLLSAINEQIRRQSKKHGDLHVILTGGDSQIVSSQLDYPAEIQSHLVLDGLVFYASLSKASPSPLLTRDI